MTNDARTVRFGTRASDLALWQTHHVADLLRAAWPELAIEIETFRTRGDRIVDTPLPLIGGKGLFTAELEAALLDGRIDCAVHSFKDLPTEEPDGLVIGAVPLRANPADALVSRDGCTLETLPQGARVGTSSLRRAAQLLRSRPDLQLADIRGNVDTRIRKVLAPSPSQDADYDAILLACAGLERLGRGDVITQVLPFDIMLPAPGQGALAVQCRRDDPAGALLAAIQHMPSRLAAIAERAFLAGLGGGCSTPVAALGEWQGPLLALRGRVCSRAGDSAIDVQRISPVNDEKTATEMGLALAEDALADGAGSLLADGEP